MCLNPIKMQTRSKRIVPDLNQNFYIEVPCGKCAECLEAKRSEWYFRTYPP